MNEARTQPSSEATSRREYAMYAGLFLISLLVFVPQFGFLTTIHLLIQIAIGAAIGLTRSTRVNVFCVGFIVGEMMEVLAWKWRGGMPGFVLPIGQHFEVIWPVDVDLIPPGQNTGENGLKCVLAGLATLGVLCGTFAVIAWSRLGLQALCQMIAAPFRAAWGRMHAAIARQSVARQRHLQLLGRLVQAAGLATVVGLVWAWGFGLWPAIAAGSAVFSLVALTIWLHWRAVGAANVERTR